MYTLEKFYENGLLKDIKIFFSAFTTKENLIEDNLSFRERSAFRNCKTIAINDGFIFRNVYFNKILTRKQIITVVTCSCIFFMKCLFLFSWGQQQIVA
jgi:hypothetical protein